MNMTFCQANERRGPLPQPQESENAVAQQLADEIIFGKAVEAAEKRSIERKAEQALQPERFAGTSMAEMIIPTEVKLEEVLKVMRSVVEKKGSGEDLMTRAQRLCRGVSRACRSINALAGIMSWA